MKFFQACDKAIEYGFYLLFFLVPLIMTPFNYELFEFNKMMLVYFLTTIIVAAWLIKMVIHKKFIFRRTFLDIPLLIFLVSQSLSFFVSIDRHTSLWGYYSRFHGGLLSTIAYLLLYWAFVSNMDKRRTQYVIRHTLISAALVAAYGILEHFGIDAQYWVQDVRHRVFSSLGQPNWLAAYLVALLPIPMAMILKQETKRAREQEKKRNLKFLLFYSSTLLLYLCFLYTRSRSGLFGFATGYLVFWGLVFFFSSQGVNRKSHPMWNRSYTLVIKGSPVLKSFLLITLLLLLITLLVGTPWTPNLGQFIQKKPHPPVTEEPSTIPLDITESGDIRKIVWKGAIEIGRHYPLFGTGPETFAYSYYWHRPREHNDVSEWDFLYNRAHNEYLNFLATTGLVGLGSYIFLIGLFIIWVMLIITNFKSKFMRTFAFIRIFPFASDSRKTNLSNTPSFLLPIALFSGYCSILVTNFFGFSVVAVALFFFLFPAISVVLATPSKGLKRNQPLRLDRSYTLGIWQWLAIAAILLSLFTSHFSLLKFWYADTLFAKGEKLNDAKQYDEAFNILQKAVGLRPGEPFYHDELSLSAAHLASLSFKQDQATISAQLADQAITTSNQALKTSPYHLNFWKNRTRVFYSLAEIDEKYYQNALESLLAASELAPTDAKTFYNLGLMYARLGQDETAIGTLEKTVELKPNYGNARYALALFYEQKGRIQEAKKQLEYILEKINPDFQPAIEKLKEL